MPVKDLLLQYVTYNHWANQRVADVLIKIDPQLLDKELKSSFPSIKKTVHHIWDAELAWIARLKKEVLAWPPTAQFKDPLISDFVKTSKDFLDFVSSKDEAFMADFTEYKNNRAELFKTHNYGMIMHCMNHSTFHRGQLITLLREVDITELPSTDLITFLRNQ
jgi:uncharacterized damage-inducible protein DinB